MGSKAKLKNLILPVMFSNLPYTPSAYVEPFVGGCNTIDGVHGIDTRIASDINPYLIAMWDALVYKNWIPPEHITREHYKDVKDNKEFYPPELVGWIGFVCSFRGKFFGGYSGNTQTKSGSIREYQKERAANIYKQIHNLEGVDFVCSEYINLSIPKNSLIYCDPPYENTTKYDIIKGDFNHATFWNWIREISRDNLVFVSEYSAPDDFECVWSKGGKCALSSGESKDCIEKLFRMKQL